MDDLPPVAMSASSDARDTAESEKAAIAHRIPQSRWRVHGGMPAEPPADVPLHRRRITRMKRPAPLRIRHRRPMVLVES
ncbi:hypothetical protein, partial [Burkholderia diffusa]|uniref:hypothetical protein n=1 Tax=Burkholderia diffusa TaxID=488732 RepID=UPI001ABB2388